MTNFVGEHLILSERQFADLASSSFEDPQTVALLREHHIIRRSSERVPVELLAIKTRTRYRHLAEFTGLHIFVVTLRCEHACPYCQVSRQSSNKSQFDMSQLSAQKALDMTFSSPSPAIKIEFQGGEPLLNFSLVRWIVARAREMNAESKKSLAFVVATNLALLDDEVIEFARQYDIYFSTSLDGPATLHNANRPRPGSDSWQRATAGIKRIQSELGRSRVSALMTTTAESLTRAREIVDCYVELGLEDVFLRPLSPYGLAKRTKSYSKYNTDDWLNFYKEGIEYIVELNRAGTVIVEHYAALILKKMLTNDDPQYVDLTSPAGIGIGALVYNYDGDVFASDESRMLAEMGDKTFRLGNLHRDSFQTMMTSDALLDPLAESITVSAPMCSDCAFEPYCGADPVFHHTIFGDVLGRKPESAFCRRNMSIFEFLLEKYEEDPFARELFRGWASR